MSFTGLAFAGAQIGLSEALLIRPQRGIKAPTYTDSTGASYTLPDIVAQATIDEHLQDEMEITDHPVELGAAISDHAFKVPTTVVLRLGWSNSPSAGAGLLGAATGAAAAISPAARAVLGGLELAGAALSVLTGANADQLVDIYNTLQTLQLTRAMFDLYTGKRVLQNMVCKTLIVENDWKSENSLMVQMHCKQIIVVNTQNVTLPASVQKNPLATASPVNNGTKSPTPVTQQSNGTFAK